MLAEQARWKRMNATVIKNALLSQSRRASINLCDEVEMTVVRHPIGPENNEAEDIGNKLRPEMREMSARRRG
jgi:hypothetical protein